jgi:hypothetical protein
MLMILRMEIDRRIKWGWIQNMIWDTSALGDLCHMVLNSDWYVSSKKSSSIQVQDCSFLWFLIAKAAAERLKDELHVHGKLVSWGQIEWICLSKRGSLWIFKGCGRSWECLVINLNKIFCQVGESSQFWRMRLICKMQKIVRVWRPSGHLGFVEELPSIYESFELVLLKPQVVSVSVHLLAQLGKSAFAVRNSQTSPLVATLTQFAFRIHGCKRPNFILQNWKGGQLCIICMCTNSPG